MLFASLNIPRILSILHSQYECLECLYLLRFLVVSWLWVDFLDWEMILGWFSALRDDLEFDCSAMGAIQWHWYHTKIVFCPGESSEPPSPMVKLQRCLLLTANVDPRPMFRAWTNARPCRLRLKSHQRKLKSDRGKLPPHAQASQKVPFRICFAFSRFRWRHVDRTESLSTKEGLQRRKKKKMRRRRKPGNREVSHCPLYSAYGSSAYHQNLFKSHRLIVCGALIVFPEPKWVSRQVTSNIYRGNRDDPGRVFKTIVPVCRSFLSSHTSAYVVGWRWKGQT